jgi:HPt (histidine-containing phosphotransfer) domain-containing protein
VHALKSASRQVGAMELSDLAAELEAAGNAQDGETIHAKTKELLTRYQWYRGILAPYFVEEKVTGNMEMSKEQYEDFVKRMRSAIDDLDSDGMETVIEEMKKYHYEQWEQEFFDQLEAAVEDIDTETCETILSEWEASYKK